MSGQQQPAGDDVKGALANAAGAFKSDGSVGGAFEKDGAIGSIGEKVGGPFAADGAVGQNFTSSGAIGGNVHDAAENVETSVAKNRVENQEQTHAKEA